MTSLSTKDICIWATLPATAMLLLNLLLESSHSIQTLTAASQERPSFFMQLSEGSALSPEPMVIPEVPAVPEAPKGMAYRYERSVVAKVTGYTPGIESCGKFADGITSTGSNAWAPWGVAADPALLPYGTLVYIPGVGYREVDDTGSAMREAWRNNKETHIDLRFQDLAEALTWGVQELPIHIFVPEKL